MSAMEPMDEANPLADKAAYVAQACTMQALRRASRIVTAEYERALRPLSLSASQFTILTALAVANAASLTDLGQRLASDRTTVSRLVRPLRQKGLVGAGARRNSLALTERGREVYAAALPRWYRAQHAMRRRLGADDADRLMALLSDI